MRRITLIFLLSFLGVGLINAQSPDMFNYQAVARDDQGNVLSNQDVGIKISILQGSASGTVVYEEEHSKTTNAQGLVNLKIGDGSVMSGTFSNIDWSSGPFFIEVGLDEAGGSDYSTMGTSQLLSVPYAKYSESSANAFSGDYENLSNKPWKSKGDTLYHENKKLAIGTDSLTHPVTIEGSGAGVTMMIRDDYPFIGLNAMNNTNAGLYLSLNNDVKGGLWYNSSNDNLILQRSDNIENDITISSSRNVGINTNSPLERLDVNGAIRVQDTTKTPEPKRIYGNSTPLAYGVIGLTSQLFTEFGIDSAKLVSTGEYTIWMKNSYEGYSTVSINPFNSSNPIISTHKSFNGGRQINVYTWDINGNATNSAFSIVVYGYPQVSGKQQMNSGKKQQKNNIMGEPIE